MRICPMCGSVNIAYVTFPHKSDAEFCKDCDYGRNMNSIFPEIHEEDIESFRKDLKESKKGNLEN